MTAALGAVARKEIRQITRDRRLMLLLVVAPAVQLLIFGYAVDFEVDHIDAVVCDLDGTATSRDLTRSLFADGTFRWAGAAYDCLYPEEDLRSGRAQVALVLPRGFERDLVAHIPAAAQVLVDATNPIVGRTASNAAAGIFASAGAPWMHDMIEQARARTGAHVGIPSLVPEFRVLYNPGLRSPLFMVPGVAALILLVVTTIATSMGLARERETGTLEQVMVTPVRPWELIAGKVFPFVVFGCVDVLVVLVLGVWVFDIPVRGSLWLLAVGTLLYLLSTVGLGLFVSTISRTQQQAFLFGFLLIMPAVLLSGVMSPIDNMPPWLQPLTAINPVRFYVEILRGVLLRAATLQDLWPAFASLLGFGAVILGASVIRFRKRLA
jgi:ABC-2 type transport system permease protein